MRLDKILVTDRHRVDLGDVSALAESIKANGLMHPVVVTTEGRMIAGHRRLEACRSLGWTDIKVTFIDGLIDAAQLLFMERDENTCRKDMTPSEKISLGRALEELERPKAEKAQAEGRQRGADRTAGRLSVPPNEEPRKRYDVREDVAPAVGLSTASYSRAKQLVTAAESGDTEAKVQVEEMDRTGKITKPYEDWTGRKVNRRTDAPTSRTPSPQPKAPPKYGHRRKHLEVLDSIATALSGLAIAANEISSLDLTVTNEEATRLTGDFSTSIKALSRINNLLKEHTK
jgi:hypothetical protein